VIRQRVLYVGIGGTGVDLGVQLHHALQSELCGPDGRDLLRVGGPFAGLPANQLPKFVQFLMIDFAQNALGEAEAAMQGGNVTAARSILPVLSNYPAVAMDLRMSANSSGCVKDWIPPVPAMPETEPSTSPLSAGAGMYPTVGRAAFFNAISSAGYGVTLANDIRRALNQLSNSLGDLNAYSNHQATEGVAVYVGFSLSGGTGAGLFLDVLQLLIHELQTQLDGNRATIIPIVFLPSTFQGSLNPQLMVRAQLNAAQGILDLTGLVAHRHKPNAAMNDFYSIKYPGNDPGTIVNAQLSPDAPKIPVVSMVSMTAGMQRTDTARTVAASIVAQLSVVESKAATTGASPQHMGFGEDLVNKVDDVSTTHSLGLGSYSLMPMVASSLTVPSQRIADLISKSVLVKGVRELKERHESGMFNPPNELVDELLENLGFREFVSRETFSVELGLNFAPPSGIRSQKDLDEALTSKRKQAENNRQQMLHRIGEVIPNKTTFNFSVGFRTLLTAHPELSIVDAIEVGRKALDSLELTVKSSEVVRTPTTKKKSGPSFLPKKVSRNEIVRNFDALEEDQRQYAESQWWAAWRNMKQSWTPSHSAGREFLRKLEEEFNRWSDELAGEEALTTAVLNESRIGVVNYIPTGGSTLHDYLDVLRENTLNSIRGVLNVQSGDMASLFTRLVAGDGDGWREPIDRLRNNAPRAQVLSAILDPIRSRVQEALTPSSGARGTMKNLSELLRNAAAGDVSEDTVDLVAKLGNLVPGIIIPEGRYKECKVVVTYPGEKDEKVEEFIRECICLDGRVNEIFSNAVSGGQNTIMFSATGRGETLRVNFNMIGQGLLDNGEVRRVLNTWASEVRNPMAQKLFWRQRVGYRHVGRIFSRADRERVVNALIRGLAGNQVKVEKGTLSSPESLRILPANTEISGALVDTLVNVPPLSNFSSWPNVVSAFEQLVLTVDPGTDFRARVIEEFYNHLPEELTDENAPIPEVIHQMCQLAVTERDRLTEFLDRREQYGSDVVRMMEDALEFWSVTFPNALQVRISGMSRNGKPSFFASIEAAMAAERARHDLAGS
jgi:hypothetical protein